MNAGDIREICRKLPGVEEDLKWGDNLCLAVGGKLFLIMSLDEVPVTASFRVDDDEYEEIASRQGFRPAPYFARYHWVMVRDIGLLDHREWDGFIRRAYELVFNKLPPGMKEKISSSAK